MQDIATLLQELDTLYTATALDEYEEAIRTVEQQVQETFPGFTIAYAEIYTAGADREPLGSMRHVLLPQQE